MRLIKKDRQRGSAAGLPVFTSDDHHIGNVKEIDQGGIRIDAPARKDYWLSERDVASATEERVVLNFGRDELDDYMRKERPPETVPEGIRHPSSADISAEERMEMRERMERGLSQQREKLQDE